MASLRSDRRLYVNADRSRVCEEGDPDSAFLLVRQGGTLSMDTVARYKFALKDGKVAYPGWGAPEKVKLDATTREDSEPVTVDGPDAEEWSLKTDPAQYVALNEDSDSEAVQEKVALAKRILAREEG